MRGAASRWLPPGAEHAWEAAACTKPGSKEPGARREVGRNAVRRLGLLAARRIVRSRRIQASRALGPVDRRGPEGPSANAVERRATRVRANSRTASNPV